MKIIYSKYIPVKGFMAMNFFGMIIVREECRGRLTGTTYVHKSIHTAQMKDFCPWLPIGGLIFYICYVFEWIYRLIFHTKTAYMGLSFEIEARAHQSGGYKYLETRKRFAQWRKR